MLEMKVVPVNSAKSPPSLCQDNSSSQGRNVMAVIPTVCCNSDLLNVPNIKNSICVKLSGLV